MSVEKKDVTPSLVIIGVVLTLFMVMVLVPQSFWVDLSIKLFK